MFIFDIIDFAYDWIVVGVTSALVWLLFVDKKDKYEYEEIYDNVIMATLLGPVATLFMIITYIKDKRNAKLPRE